MIGGLEEKIENAGPLFQLLLKYQLTQESVSMTIIRILESHLIVKIDEKITVASSISSQLRVAFISEFLQNVVLRDNKPIKQCTDIYCCINILTF